MNDMMNIAPAGNLPAVRTIPEIEADILAQKRTIGASIVFIGRALIEAKEQLTHGEWGRWLSERVEFSVSSAENYMRIAREFAEGSRLLEMPYSKVLALLPVPKEERESFATANNVEDKSVAEIKRLVRERDEARKHAAAAEAEIEKAHRYLDKQSKNIESLIDAKQAAEERVRELEARKPERVTVEVAPDDYKKVMAERHEMEGRVLKAEEAVQHMILERNEALSQMAREIANAEEERDAALEELEAEKASGTGADPLDVTPFCDACAALLNRLYAAPYAQAAFMTKTEIELKRYEDNVQLVLEWAYKTQNMIERVQVEKFGKELVFQVL